MELEHMIGYAGHYNDTLQYVPGQPNMCIMRYAVRVWPRCVRLWRCAVSPPGSSWAGGGWGLAKRDAAHFSIRLLAAARARWR